MNRSGRNGLATLAVGVSLGASLALGCAGWSGPFAADSERPLDRGQEIRPQAPADYDVLVGQQHEFDGRLPEALAAYERAVAKDEDSHYLHTVLAEALARSNRLDEAVVHAERALELDPQAEPARMLLGHLYRIQRRPEAAEAILLDAEGEPYDLEGAFLLYQIYLDSGEPEKARGTAEWMVARDPEDLRAQIALANAFQRLARPVDAERVLRRALEIAPGNLRIYSALAGSMRERGDRDGEIAVYREVLDQYPDDHESLIALADAQMAQEDLEGAIQTLEFVERRFPSDLRSIMRLGFLLYEARRFEGAVMRFDQVLAANPEEHEIAFFLGVARRRAGREDGALAAFASIPPTHQHYSEARAQMASIYDRRGDYTAALEEVERAQAAEPSRELDVYSATLRAKAGDFDAAVTQMEALIGEHPNDDELIYNLGVVYGEGDRPDDAIAAMQLALEINPDNASALNYIGYSWAERGENLDEAERMIVRAIALRPDDGYIVDSLGWVYYMRARPLVEAGEHDKALEYLTRALQELERAQELTGGDPVISEHIGDTYLLLDQRRRALERFEEAASLGPREREQPELRRKLEGLRSEFE